jgi:hypothetical protein
MKAAVEWISVDDALPGNSASVLAAVTGRYPSGEEFWLGEVRGDGVEDALRRVCGHD